MPSDEEENPVFWKGTVNGLTVEIKPVTKDNLNEAINIAAQGFPGELKAVVRSFVSSTRPREQWTLENSKTDLIFLEYYLICVDGNPAGVSGGYILKVQPDETWLGWTSVSYIYRGLGLAGVLVDFASRRAEAAGQKTVRAWSVKTPTNRFGIMHGLLGRRWSKTEVFQGSRHSFGEYYIFSQGLNGNPTSPCPASSTMTGGSETPMQETARLFRIQKALTDYSIQKKLSVVKVKEFKQTYGNATQYAEAGRFVDLTEDIKDQKLTSFTESFSRLNEKLFPLEEEREVVFGESGLKVYVQPDKHEKYAPSARRILAVLDKDKINVIAAIVFNICVFPSELRSEYDLDANLGVTYLMTDNNYRGFGLGSFLVKAAKDWSVLFVKSNSEVSNPKIMLMTEQNLPSKMKVSEHMIDFEAVLIGAYERQIIWGKLNQRLVKEFSYVQVSLRPGLNSSTTLGLFVTMPNENDHIPSEILKYSVITYADLALNKQQRPIDLNPEMGKMLGQIKSKPHFPLEQVITRFANMDNLIMAAQIQESVGGLSEPPGKPARENMMLGDLMAEYRDKINADSAL